MDLRFGDHLLFHEVVALKYACQNLRNSIDVCLQDNIQSLEAHCNSSKFEAGLYYFYQY